MKQLTTLRRTAAVLALFSAGAFSACAQAEDALNVQTASGPVNGIEHGGISAWLGLPYAAPPVGERR